MSWDLELTKLIILLIRGKSVYSYMNKMVVLDMFLFLSKWFYF